MIKTITAPNLNKQSSLSGKKRIETALESFYLVKYLEGEGYRLAREATYSVKISDIDNQDNEIASFDAECSFSSEQISKSTYNLSIVVLGNCWNVVHSALCDKYGTNITQSISSEIDALRAIVACARNAFSHDPTEPKWFFKKTPSSYYERLWTFTTPSKNNTITVDLRNKHNKILTPSDFGGYKAMMVIWKYAQQLV